MSTTESRLQAIRTWLIAVTELPSDRVLIAPFGAVRPELSYVTLQMVNPSIAPQHDELSFVVGEGGVTLERIKGHRTATVDLNFYGETSGIIDIVEALRLSLESPSMRQIAADLGVHVLSAGDPRDLSFLRDVEFEGRIQMELQVGWAMAFTREIASIETVILTAELGTSEADSDAIELEFEAVPPAEP